MTEPTFEEIDALAKEISGWPIEWPALDEWVRTHYRIEAVRRLSKPPADPNPQALVDGASPAQPQGQTPQDP